jgi:Tol biopolymer transport system component
MRSNLVRSLFLALLLAAATTATAALTTCVSRATDGTLANSSSYQSSVSADGRYVAFYSLATNLAPGGCDGHDVFVRDRLTGQTEQVSVASDGTLGNGSSYSPSISADGRYVAFESIATNLVDDDTNGLGDIFVHDRQTGETTRVSVATDGTQGNSTSSYAAISADGTAVAFQSDATNLVGDDTNGFRDVFVHDRATGQTSRVSVASDGSQGSSESRFPSISTDGRYVAFQSWASNLVADDNNGFADIFVRDQQGGQTTRVSIATGGTEANGPSERPWVSGSGRYVVFESSATNLVADDTNAHIDIFLRDSQAPQTTRVSVATDGSQGNGDSRWCVVNSNGRQVAFMSYATNLVAGDTNGCGDVFLRDRPTGQTTRLSVATDGTQSSGESHSPAISADGQSVTFTSGADNLVPDDQNSSEDVFLHDRAAYRPDAMVRAAGDTKFRGNNIYNTTGANQSRSLTIAPGAKAVYEVQAQNDAAAADRFLIRGGASARGWVVHYYDRATGGNEITAQVTGDGWASPVVARGERRIVRLEVKAKADAPAGATKTMLVSATSVADGTTKDAAKAVTTVAAGPTSALLSGLAAIPARDGAQIIVALSSPAEVAVTVRNLAGRAVRALCHAQVLEAGRTTLLWDGRDDAGLRLPGGSYLVEVGARAPDGPVSRATSMVRLGR